MHAPVPVRRSLGTAALAVAICAPAGAFQVAIGTGPRAVYLQVGSGTIAGGTYSGGGTPQDNPTINVVTVTVPPATLGSGSQPMTSNSTVANSPYDGFSYCAPPAQVYIGGFFRIPNNANRSATLSVTTPANLTSPTGGSIPFSQISWVSGGSGDTTPTIPSGTFTGGTQTLLTLSRNQWFESCMAFTYANSVTPPAGTFSGRATYTLVAP